MLRLLFSWHASHYIVQVYFHGRSNLQRLWETRDRNIPHASMLSTSQNRGSQKSEYHFCLPLVILIWFRSTWLFWLADEFSSDDVNVSASEIFFSPNGWRISAQGTPLNDQPRDKETSGVISYFMLKLDLQQYLTATISRIKESKT
jgi:hypothetical protein